MKYDHPILINIRELYSNLIRDGREIVFVWVLGHVGISGNLAADSAAKDALDGDVSAEYIPFSDFKPRLNSYITEVWQNEWDYYPLNKLHKICTFCHSSRRQETVLSRLHIGHSFLTHCFLLKVENPPPPQYCILYNKMLRLEHVLLHCLDLIQVRDKYINANRLHV